MARFRHSSDAKGRIVIPARLREAMGPLLHVTLSLDDGYLAIYTDERFQSLKRQIDAQRGTSPAVRRLQRDIIGEALPCNIDGQGRIAISDELWSMIAVEPGEPVYLIEMGDTILLCSVAHFERERREAVKLSELDLDDIDVSGII